MNSESYISELAISTWVLWLQSLHTYSRTLFNLRENPVWQSSASKYLILTARNLTELQRLDFFLYSETIQFKFSIRRRQIERRGGMGGNSFHHYRPVLINSFFRWLTRGNYFYCNSFWNNNFSTILNSLLFRFKSLQRRRTEILCVSHALLCWFVSFLGP
jgi:hypothetical protein